MIQFKIFDMYITGWLTLFDNKVNSFRKILSPILISTHAVSIMSAKGEMINQDTELLIKVFRADLWACLLVSSIISALLLSTNNFILNYYNLFINLFYFPFVLAFGAKMKGNNFRKLDNF